MRLLARNKQTAFDALLKVAQLDVPKALVQSETESMVQSARQDLKQRGVKDADSAPIPAEMFTAQAERRVRLGLAVGKLVEINKLQATPEQIKAHIEELAQSYEKPSEVVTWYYSKRERLAEVEAVVVENNVTGFILANAKITEKAVPFDDVMQA
jgi:trigger factor